MKEKLHSLSLVILFFLTLGVLSYIQSAYGLSPSFVRQELDDDPNDIAATSTSQECLRTGILNITDKLDGPEWYTRSLSTEITGVSYSSDGRFLNATIWLESPLSQSVNETEKQALNRSSSQNITLVAAYFEMIIDVHSSFDRGYDYQVSIDSVQNISLGNKETFELSSFSNKKVLSTQNISNYYSDVAAPHVSLDFDLALANYPKDYNISFLTGKGILVNQTASNCFDTTAIFPVPPPDLLINASVNPLYLRPGEEKEVNLNIRSKAGINTNLEFYNKYSNPGSDKKSQIPNGVKVNINPANLTLFPMGSALSTLTVNSTEDTLPQSFAIPLRVEITLPDLKPPIAGYDPTYGFVFDQQVLTSVTKEYYLTITLLPKLSFDEWLNDVVSRWVSPFSALWTFLAGIGAVMAPLVIRMYTRKKKEKSADQV